MSDPRVFFQALSPRTNPMGIVTDYLRTLISKQVDDHGLVGCYDPENAYGTAAVELSLPNAGARRALVSLEKKRNFVEGYPPRSPGENFTLPGLMSVWVSL